MGVGQKGADRGRSQDQVERQGLGCKLEDDSGASGCSATSQGPWHVHEREWVGQGIS